jgi:hypothetical protein
MDDRRWNEKSDKERFGQDFEGVEDVLNDVPKHYNPSLYRKTPEEKDLPYSITNTNPPKTMHEVVDEMEAKKKAVEEGLEARLDSLRKLSDLAEDSLQKVLTPEQALKLNPEYDLTTGEKLQALLANMTTFLLEKNKRYGDSAMSPLSIFTKHLVSQPENVRTILVRLDDKLSRIKNSETLRANDLWDAIGYLNLLCVSLGFLDPTSTLD